MECRLARPEELPKIQEMYRTIIRKMEADGIPIWDEVYPCALFEEDIRARRLYLLLEDGDIAAACALCASNAGEEAVEWTDGRARALYLDRLGVHPARAGRGIGSRMLREAGAAAKALGAAYLRLFVVDRNVPAIRLYQRNGFRRGKGIYSEKIDGELVLREFPYEIKL